MSKMQQRFTLTALSAALLAIHGPAPAAEDVDVKELTQPSSEVSIGAGGLFGDDRRQAGIIGGLRDTGGYLLLDADINRRDEATGTWHTLSVTNMGMTSREILGEFIQQGRQGVAIEYRQSEREVPYLVNTGITGFGTSTQSVPVPGIPPGSGTNYQLGTERTKFGLEFFKYLMPNLNFKVSVSNEDKEGNRHGRVGGQPEFAAVPIDYNVRKVDMRLDYVADKLQLSGGYSGSWFQNANDLLTTTRAGDANSPYYISQPLDNQAHQFFIDGGYTISPTTHGSFKLSYTHATQDERIPTYDIVGLARSATAPSSLDGEVNTTLVQLGLTSRPMPKLNVLANLRYHKVDDRTPAWFVVDTATDAHSTPFDYETLSGKLEGSYNLAPGYNLIVGIDYSDQDRTVPVGTVVAGVDTERYVPFRAEIDETTYRVQLRKSLSETLNGTLAFLHSSRGGSQYSHAEHAVGVINPIHISDRDRNKLRLMVDWSPMSRLNLQANFEGSQDDYGSANEYGLYEGSARLYALDADYSLSDKWRVTAWYSHDETEADQFNGRWTRATGEHEADRRAHLEDKGDSVGLGVRGEVSAKVKIGADLQWTRTVSKFDDVVTLTGVFGVNGYGTVYPTSGGVTAVPLPDITSTMTRLNLFAEYAFRKNADLRFDLMFERWKTDDWTWEFSTGAPFTFGTTNDGTTIYSYPKQTSTFVGIRYKYKFQ